MEFNEEDRESGSREQPPDWPRPEPDPVGDPPDEREAERLEKLYQEVEVVKMAAMQRLVKAMQPDPTGLQGDVVKEGQAVLRAVETHLRLLGALRRQPAGSADDPDGAEPPGLAEIWGALIELPQTGALLRRESVRQRLLSGLRRRAPRSPGRGGGRP